MPPAEELTEDRHVLRRVKSDELWFTRDLIAWFVHEDSEIVRWASWGDVWKAAVWFTGATECRPRAVSQADIAWRWLAEVAAFAAEQGNVRLPAQILGCALYWELCDWPPQSDAMPLRPPVAPAGTKTELAAIALRCLLLLPAGEGVLYKYGVVWTAADLAGVAAETVNTLGARYGLLTRELAELAGDTLAGRCGHARWR